MAAAITAELGAGLRAARLAGAAEAVQHAVGAPLREPELLERFLAPARAAIAPQEWQAELAAGRALSQQEAITLLVSPGPARQPARLTQEAAGDGSLLDGPAQRPARQAGPAMPRTGAVLLTCANCWP